MPPGLSDWGWLLICAVTVPRQAETDLAAVEANRLHAEARDLAGALPAFGPAFGAHNAGQPVVPLTADGAAALPDCEPTRNLSRLLDYWSQYPTAPAGLPTGPEHDLIAATFDSAGWEWLKTASVDGEPEGDRPARRLDPLFGLVRLIEQRPAVSPWRTASFFGEEAMVDAGKVLNSRTTLAAATSPSGGGRSAGRCEPAGWPAAPTYCRPCRRTAPRSSLSGRPGAASGPAASAGSCTCPSGSPRPSTASGPPRERRRVRHPHPLALPAALGTSTRRRRPTCRLGAEPHRQGHRRPQQPPAGHTSSPPIRPRRSAARHTVIQPACVKLTGRPLISSNAVSDCKAASGTSTPSTRHDPPARAGTPPAAEGRGTAAGAHRAAFAGATGETNHGSWLAGRWRIAAGVRRPGSPTCPLALRLPGSRSAMGPDCGRRDRGRLRRHRTGSRGARSSQVAAVGAAGVPVVVRGGLCGHRRRCGRDRADHPAGGGQ